MENNTQEESFLQMHLDYDGGNLLKEAVRWSRFLSIVGIILLSIFLLIFALLGTTIAGLLSTALPGLAVIGGILLILVCLAVFAVTIFAAIMLYRFSSLTRKGIEQQDHTQFAEGMKCLKIYFVISGILGILTLLGNLASLTKLFHA